MRNYSLTCILILSLITPQAFALLFNHGDDSSESQSGGILHRHHHNSSEGIVHSHLNGSASNKHISSTTKTAAKVVACETIGKGICLGVAGVKYAKKELNESASPEPSAKHSESH